MAFAAIFAFVLCLLAAASAVADARSLNHGIRIMGGQETTIDRFPFQASIRFYGEHRCGGSIISAKHIISASHCFLHGFEPEIKVRVGSTYRKKGGKLHDVVKVAAYPRPTPYDYNMDVAIVVVSPDIEFGPTVRPISLVAPTKQPQVGETLIFSGWGITEPYHCTKPFLVLSDHLRAISFPMLKPDYCRQAFVNFVTKFTENMICGGGVRGIAAGKGDSGGGLVNSRNELVGIVSWGHPHFPTEEPSVFTSIASPAVRKYIDDFFKNENQSFYENGDSNNLKTEAISLIQ